MNRYMRGFVMGAALIFASSVPAWATPFTVSINPIHICSDAGAGCGNVAERLFEAEGDKIWAQAGIDLVFLPWAQINETDFLDVTVGNNAVIDPEAQAVMTTGIGINNTALTLVIKFFFPNARPRPRLVWPGLWRAGLRGLL